MHSFFHITPVHPYLKCNRPHLADKRISMKRIAAFLSALLISNLCLAAQPTDESINKLIDASNATQAIKSMKQQVDNLLKNTIHDATNGKPASADEQKIFDGFQQRVKDIVLKQFDEDKMRAMYLPIYREVYTQDEIDQMIAFYESPTGKMFASKTPVVVQKTMSVMQQQMGPMMQEMQQAANDMQTQLKELRQNSQNSGKQTQPAN
jgi:hypothetical protein